MKRLAIGLAVAVAVLIGGGVALLPVAEAHLARQVKARIEQRGTIKVSAVEIGFFRRQIVLKDLEIAGPDDGAVKAARVEAHGLAWPFADLLAGRTPLSGWRWGDPFHAGSVEITELLLRNQADLLEGRIATLVFEDVDLPRHEVPAGTAAGGLSGPANALSHLSLRKFEARGLVIQSLDGNGFGLQAVSAVGEQFERGQIKSIEVAGAEIRDRATGPSPWLTVAAILARDVDLRMPIDRLKDPEWLPGMPTGRTSFAELNMRGFGGDVLTRQGITLGRVSIESKRDGQRAVGRTKVEEFALRPQGLSLEAMQTMAMLMSLGVREVKASLDCSGGEDRAKGELEIDRCVLGSPGLADLDLSLKVINGDELFWRALDEGDLYLLFDSRAGLGSLKLVVRDNSLLERLVNLYAVTSGVARPQARAALAREVRRFQPTDMLITEDLTRFADTIARFVEQGGTLVIEARPDPPLTADAARIFGSPGPDVVSVLGLTATLSK